MPDVCIPDVARLADRLGFSCVDAPPLIHLRDPSALANWTLPLLEFTFIGGAVLALVLALKARRGLGDPTRVALWFSSIVYVLVIEPPIYFPRLFGLESSVGIVFVHNVFTVDLMFDRLPLYIVALYPALLTLAYDIVRSLGVFARYGRFTAAVCVGFVHSVFYEIFDHIGPQLKWWVWNTENSATAPALGAVPLTSMALFSAGAPIAVAYFVHRWVAQPVARGRRFTPGALLVRTVAIGVLGTVAIGVLGIPAWLFARASAVQTFVYWSMIAAILLVGVVTVARAWPSARSAGGARDTGYARAFGTWYLVVMATSWGVGLPDYFAAVEGVTPSGTATGSLAYAAACFVAAALLVIAMFALRGRAAAARIPYRSHQAVDVGGTR
ncbi:hypothetical protein MU0083_003584 [[Mycobacterium] kokjensenii]|uniref:Acyltransferase n=1 Tax=[Mycobacterium] kokjensenii TaxID=3064287 RepID=A0ABN9NEJ2_9MYCO|nr:hypothetical protein [Mycolicibacter sp. MU0083]CAJ1505017.1 hypothetical protein MU0083_003584 [Mycolicibacter sp. MU0083]